MCTTPVPCVLCGVEPGTFRGEDLCTKGLLCPECDGSEEGLKTFSKYEDAVSDWNKRQEKVLKALPLAKRCERLQALLESERRVSQWRDEQLAEKSRRLQTVISACTTKAWYPGTAAANLAEKIVDIAIGR